MEELNQNEMGGSNSGLNNNLQSKLGGITNLDGAKPKEEGEITKAIENYTTEIPSGFFLGAALGAMGLSAALQLFGAREDSRFVGQWVPTILILGLYNKLVKLHGSEEKPEEHML